MAPLTTVSPYSNAPADEPSEQGRVMRLLDAALATQDEHRAARLRKEAVILCLDLADGLAHRYRGRGVELNDLQQVARTALVKAALGYRPGLGQGFAPYASVTISGELKRHFRDQGWSVRPPRRLQELRAHLSVREEELQHELHRSPTVPELADAMEVECDEVREAVVCSSAYRAVSLSAPNAFGTPLGDHLPCPDDDFAALETSAALGCLIAELNERDRQILSLRFVDELTQSEIGCRIGLSQMQVSRLLSSILERLRAGLVDDRESA